MSVEYMIDIRRIKTDELIGKISSNELKGILEYEETYENVMFEDYVVDGQKLCIGNFYTTKKILDKNLDELYTNLADLKRSLGSCSNIEIYDKISDKISNLEAEIESCRTALWSVAKLMGKILAVCEDMVIPPFDNDKKIKFAFEDNGFMTDMYFKVYEA